MTNIEISSPEQAERYRWYVAFLLFLATTCNYVDRQALSVLAHTIQQELGLTTTMYSYITSSFLASYTVMYAVSGRLVDRLGTRRSFAIFVSGWSVADILHAFARSGMGFGVCRFLLGAMEPANFPASIKAVSEWFPMRERALAVGIFNSGTALGAAISVPVVSYIALAAGWRYAFVATGVLGFVWVALWMLTYRGPRRLKESPLEAAPSAPSVKALLRMRETWGCILARALTDPVTYFLVFWIPKYLQEQRGFTVADLGLLGWIPFVALAIGNIAGGAIPNILVRRGWSLNLARKSTMGAASFLIPICCLLVTRVGSPMFALAILGAMMFGHACWGNITLPSEVFPKEAVGTVTGLGGSVGGFFGVLSQLTIGRVVEHFSFTPAFVGCAVVYLLAFFVVLKLVPQLGVIRELPAA